MNTPKRVRSDKLSISLPTEMAKWIRDEARAELSNASNVIRQHLMQAYDARNKKESPHHHCPARPCSRNDPARSA